MKHYLLFIGLLLSYFVQAQKIEMPIASFITGDDVTYSYPVTDDSKWKTIRPDVNWEMQNFEKYDGFAWYRFHVFIPLSLKTNSYLKDSLSISMARVDDACEVFFNGTLIGKSGSFPQDVDGYKSTWNNKLQFNLSANSSFINWNGENVISVRAYDGGGAGGIFGALPYLHMIDLVDAIKINNNSPVKFINTKKAKKDIIIENSAAEKISGIFNYYIVDVENNKTEKFSTPVSVLAHSSFNISIPIKLAERNNIVYEFVEHKSLKSTTLSEIMPYILTPPVSSMPKINGARIFGVRPGSPFLFKIPATGKKPLQYSVESLPTGLQVDKTTGIITGRLNATGEYKMNFIVKNVLGTDKKTFTIKCGDLLALTPPMGWNSWNCWGLSVSDEKLKSSAEAMINKGLIDHGWMYINIDDGWEAEKRNTDGTIASNSKFPNLKETGNWLHSKGLKFGIYSSPGTHTCGGFLGSYGHEEQDAKSYADWGIDYLKYDWCSYQTVYENEKDSSLEAYKKPYQLMQTALQKQNRDIVYSLCQYGMKDVWKWGASVNGNCWRTTYDIEDTWESLTNIGFSQTTQHTFASPGRWNDPDMMIVGQVGWGENLHTTRLTPDEQYTHVSLWCLLSAPLLIGCDISKLDDFTLNLLTNDEVIAVDQDPMGNQATQVLKNENYQVWMKTMQDGSRVIGLFNLSGKDDVIRFHWSDISVASTQLVRDLWRQKDLGVFRGMFASKVAAHGVTLIKITENK